MHRISSALLALAPLLFTAAGHGQVTFDEQGPVVVGVGPSGGAVLSEMDGFNGPDLFASCDSLGGFNYSFLPNDGVGGFAIAQTLDFSDSALIAVGDWDGDGAMDILACEPVSPNDIIRYLRQVGPGNWESVDTRFVLGDRSVIRTVDANGDGRVDLLLANSSTDTVDVYLNDATGLLGGIVAEQYAMGDAVDLECADLNGDGAVDILTLSETDGMLRIRFNEGVGTFGPIVDIALFGTPTDVVAGDFNGDGRLDLAVARSTANDVAILLNAGSGTFPSIMSVPVSVPPRHLATADLDCDRDADLVVAPIAPQLLVLLNDGTGGGWTEVSVDTSAPVDSIDVLAGEIDGVAGTDIVAVYDAGLATAYAHLNATGACDTCVSQPFGLVALYDGDDCLPTDLLETHDGAYVGTPFCPAARKVGGGALGFADGTYITVPSDPDLEPVDGDFTMHAWVRTTSPGLAPIASKVGPSGYQFDLSGGHVRLVLCDGFVCWEVRGATQVNDGNWHHVAFTVDRGPLTTMTVYVDGIIEDQVFAPVGTVSATTPLLLGAGPSPLPTAFLNGVIDELQIYSRALTIAELQDAYHAGVSGVCRCANDLSGDGEIGFDDLLAVLSSWGPCAACPEDINNDGVVDFADLLLVLSGYGPCGG